MKAATAAWGLGLALAASALNPAWAEEPCVWEAQLPEATTPAGHRVAVIFSSFAGQSVQLQVGGQPVLERTLTTSEWSAAYSASVQCRLQGRQHLTVTVDGRATGLYLDIDGPLQIYLSPSTDGLQIALHETPADVYLLE
jgi:hypothetical protein